MKQIRVREEEAGQRLDRLLSRYLKEAPKSFLYKMMRKKNITLNGRKAEGKEKLVSGDTLTLFLSEDTIKGFGQERPEGKKSFFSCEEAYRKLKGVQVVYEDDHILIMNKPSGRNLEAGRKWLRILRNMGGLFLIRNEAIWSM